MMIAGIKENIEENWESRCCFPFLGASGCLCDDQTGMQNEWLWGDFYVLHNPNGAI